MLEPWSRNRAYGGPADLVLDAALDLFLGSRCAGCATPGRCWCRRCAGSLSGPARRTRPDPAPPGLPDIWAVGVNTGPVADAVVAHKDRGELGLARPLGAALGRALAAALSDIAGPMPSLVLPVPSTRRAVRRRGYDPLARIGRYAVRSPEIGVLGVRPRLLPALAMIRPVADQASLGSRDRLTNLVGAFAVRDRHRARLRGADVLLVDDLVTTGATLVEATRALAEAGATVRSAAVIAATARDRTRKTRGHLPHRVPIGTGSG